jgi:hypothetical protein
MKLEITPLHNPETLLTINNAAVPEVNLLNEAKARWLVEQAALARMTILNGQAAGVIIVLSDTAGFESDYYGWFVERYRNFIYIDRVIVAEWARGQGVASALYQEVEQAAQAQRLAIAAEVYAQPPNIPSLNFHRKRGFQEVGQQINAAEGKTVAKLMKYLAHAHPKEA